MSKEKVIVVTDENGNKMAGTESAFNGYSQSKVEHAKKWLEEHKVTRNINVEDVIKEYNYLKDTNVSSTGCKSCSLNKYLMGIQNYARLGEKTLKVMGRWQDKVETATLELIETIEAIKDETVEAPKEVVEEVKEETETAESPVEEEVKEERKLTKAECLAKAREAKALKKAQQEG